GRPDADSDEYPAAAAVLLRGGTPGVQRRSAEKPGQVGDGGVAGEQIAPPHRHRFGRFFRPPAWCRGAFVVLERKGYSGRTQVSPTRVSATRSCSGPAAAIKRAIGSWAGSRLSLKVEGGTGHTCRASLSRAMRQACSGEAWL